MAAAEHDAGTTTTAHVPINRSFHPKFEGTSKDQRAPKEKGEHVGMDHHGESHGSARGLDLSFDGVDFYQSRFANQGNQFSLEPPDQGLCVGNGYVLESTNDVLRVFNTEGEKETGTVALNQFYGYAPAINRTTGAYGPELTDPSCVYDHSSRRWFHIVLTLEHAGTTSALSGKNHLDLAVSKTSNPLDGWTIYRIPVQDDGTDGTPNHMCGGACLGDYPHIGADEHGFYITTNEFGLFSGGYYGSQIYAISKEELAGQSANIHIFQYNTGDPTFNSASGLPGFTVWPAISAGESPAENHGTEYFLSSLAIFSNTGVDNRLQLWSLTDTKALDHGMAPTLMNTLVNTEGYAIPGYARQPGVGTNGVGQAPNGGNIDFPLGQCLNDPTCATQYIIGQPDPYTETISPLAGNDSRMQQVMYADGKLWASLGTGLSFGPNTFSDGLAYFILDPKSSHGTPTATVVKQGYLGDPALDMTYGTVGVTASGHGVLSFTATGPNNYPGVGYANFDDEVGVSNPRIVRNGQGANDGFTGYQAFGAGPRWGDYGATAVDGNSVWFAQEYIGQSCSLSEYVASNPFGTCDKSRAGFGNWGTRISKVTP